MSAKQNKSKKKSKSKKSENKEKIKGLKENIEQLQEEIIDLKDELAEKNDKLLRSYADLQNYQKRTQKDLLSKEEETKRKYISELIDLKELLEKAYEDKKPKQGLKLILNNLHNFLEKEDITCIECIGEKFDHNLHHAVTTIEKEGCEDEEIVEEVKKGFKCGDKILRPAHVIVVKNQKKNDEVK